jgi:hypothetical protein
LHPNLTYKAGTAEAGATAKRAEQAKPKPDDEKEMLIRGLKEKKRRTREIRQVKNNVRTS